MAEPEDVALELAEDREWERLMDVVESFDDDTQSGTPAERAARERCDQRDEPHFQFADE